ncbi:ATP-binding protein [Aggregatilineales bacterium SYSU G02658]
MSPLFLIANGFFLALALAFLLIILWYDARRTEYQFFAAFLVLVMVWNVGSLLQQVSGLLAPDLPLQRLSNGIATIGLTGSSAALYALCAVLVGTRLRWFRAIASLAIVVTVLLNTVIVLSQAAYRDILLEPLDFGSYFYLFFATASVFVAWRYRRTIDNQAIMAGILLFVVGQGLGFVNRTLGVDAIGMLVSSLGCLIISGAFVRRELIVPLVSRNQQLLNMHEVSLAISKRITTRDLLDEIGQQAKSWLRGDATAIYLWKRGDLRLESVNNLPSTLLGITAQEGSFARAVSQSQTAMLLEHYATQWANADELSMFRFAFGSVIGTPLIYDNEVIGVLIVISSVQSRVFTPQDVTLLDLLASQAAVALAHEQLFSNREVLATQIQLANDQLQTVLASTKSPVLALDRNLVVVFSNAAAYEVLHSLGLNQSVLIMSDVLRPLLPPRPLEAIRRIRRYGVYVYELAVADKTYQCRLSAWGTRRVEGWVAVLHDVTELKELDRIKSEMVRMTSHDLKNPLQAALANLDLLKDDLSSLESDASELLLSADNVEKQLIKMQRIIGGILDLERARVGVQSAEVFEIAPLVRKVYDEMADMAHDRCISFQLQLDEPLGSINGNGVQLERALSNLIENALKFTPAGGEVLLRTHQVGAVVEIVVADSGVGIPPEQHERIFERFYRGQQSGIEHISGTGLGLSLVKAVVENHRGRVWVESELGKGARFYVQLPVYNGHSVSVR